MISRAVVYLDSQIFIDLLKQTEERFKACRALWDRALNDEIVIVTSTMAIAEFVHLPPVDGDDEIKLRKMRDLFEQDFIVVRQVTRATATLASDLARQHSLKPPDAIHIATALLAKVSVFYTYDGAGGDKKKLLAKTGTIGSPPLVIAMPPEPPAPPEPPLDLLENG